MTLRLYLAGKMTGEPNYAFPQFDHAEQVLTGQGFWSCPRLRIDRDMGWVGPWTARSAPPPRSTT